jgi:hypothetical protein
MENVRRFRPLEKLKYNITNTALRLALSKGPNRVDISLPSLEDGKDPVSETLCFLVFRIPDDG